MVHVRRLSSPPCLLWPPGFWPVQGALLTHLPTAQVCLLLRPCWAKDSDLHPSQATVWSTGKGSTEQGGPSCPSPPCVPPSKPSGLSPGPTSWLTRLLSLGSSRIVCICDGSWCMLEADCLGSNMGVGFRVPICNHASGSHLGPGQPRRVRVSTIIS